jgi:hypothetical protein
MGAFLRRTMLILVMLVAILIYAAIFEYSYMWFRPYHEALYLRCLLVISLLSILSLWVWKPASIPIVVLAGAALLAPYLFLKSPPVFSVGHAIAFVLVLAGLYMATVCRQRWLLN